MPFVVVVVGWAGYCRTDVDTDGDKETGTK